jgi:hypothetical protein
VYLQDAADDSTFGKHVVIVVVPLARRAGGRCVLQKAGTTMAASGAFFGSSLFLLSQMFQPKPAAHLCDLVEIKIAVCSLCDGSGRITPPAGRSVRDAIAVDCELMNQDRHSLAQSHFQINS